MRLYQILDTHTGKPVPGLYFNDKPLAKRKRQELNGDESDPTNLKYVVSPGPDHRKHNARRS